MRSEVATPGDSRDYHRGDNGTAQGRQCVILSIYQSFMRFQKVNTAKSCGLLPSAIPLVQINI